MSNRSPFDIPAANECHECEGRGYTYHTAQVGKQTQTGYLTQELGYGCLNCGGIGRTSFASDEAIVDVK